MQLIPQDENKRWQIYNVCLFIVIVCVLLFAALFVVLLIYPHDRDKQNIFLIPIIVSSIGALIAFAVIRRLYLTKHFEANQYSLPYKLDKDKAIPIIFAGCAIAWSALSIGKATSDPSLLTPPLLEISTSTSRLLTVPGWALEPLIVCVVMLLIYLFVTWQGVTLHQDHLHYYAW